MIDTLAVVETPEGIALQLRSAGALPRACAWALDFMIRFAAAFIAATALGALGASGIGLYLLVLFALWWLYPVLFEVLRDGQTPGKRVMRLRVVNANGTPVTWLASIVRNLLRVVDMMPLCYGFGLVASLTDRQGRRIGDLVARTLVVYAGAPLRAGALPPTPALVAPLALRPAERAAIIEFAERSAQLTPERQQELAGLLGQLTQAQGTVAVQRLHGMATAYVGRA
ncbi:MAG: RDD family protein [Dokdonella sp.]|uniref:RDD family protein n=1 Tax=Dokdonella sp. TaxID=2291710 RepID=UPI0025C6A64B|nr:RDD family protein [Dokdonella sp.]MBX3701843.1 RDD family protein [Dokdonella sp.]MCW5577470.1 RDD family protein [Dokdonella sp.]